LQDREVPFRRRTPAIFVQIFPLLFLHKQLDVFEKAKKHCYNNRDSRVKPELLDQSFNHHSSAQQKINTIDVVRKERRMKTGESSVSSSVLHKSTNLPA
jgi:hypothetical protein